MSKPKAVQEFGLRDRLRMWRQAVIASPRFRSIARKTPGLSQITNARANALFDLTAGFAHSQILLACVELELFDLLREQPRSIAEIATRSSLSQDAAERLMRAAKGLDLVAKTQGGQWTLGDQGLVVAESPGIAAMVRHHAIVYRDLADPVGLLRAPPDSTETSRFWSYVRGDVGPEDAHVYSELMRLSQDMVIEEVLDAYSLANHKHLVDVGGGNGAFISAAGQRWPHLKLTLFDLPAVAQSAHKRIGQGKLAPRLQIKGGSFFDDSLPAEPDCYALMRVLYDHDDRAALRLLKNIRRSMQPGDTLIIGEPMAGDSQGAKRVAAYFTFYLLAMRSGRCRTPDDIFVLLRSAGFSRMREHRTKLPVVAGLVSAQI